MFPEIERFGKWLRCQSPHATTHIHYTSDVALVTAAITYTYDAANRLTSVDGVGYTYDSTFAII